MGRTRIEPGGLPTLLEAQEVVARGGPDTLTCVSPAVGTIFAILAQASKSIGKSGAVKEPLMRQQRTYSIPQTYAYTPSKDILQRSLTSKTPGRASKCVSFVLGLALGTGVAVLLSLLSSWYFPSTPATAASVRSDDQAKVRTLSLSEVGEPGRSSALLADPFARF